MRSLDCLLLTGTFMILNRMCGPPTPSASLNPFLAVKELFLTDGLRFGRTLRMALLLHPGFATQTAADGKSFAAGKSLTPGKGSVAAAAEQSAVAWVLVQRAG